VFRRGGIRYPSRKRVDVVAKQELGGRVQSKSSNKILNAKEFLLDVLYFCKRIEGITWNSMG